MEHHYFQNGAVKLHAVSEGDGPPVLLLHGFPEFWFSWRRQIPALAAAGFRAVAPDLRGYGDSDKPRGVREYTLEKLAGDVAAMARALGGRVHVVGHDWGGGVAWAFAHLYPELLGRLAILNCPHPELMKRTLLRSFGQLRRSWYMFYFQLPWLPERSLLRPDFIPRALRGYTRNKAAHSDADLARYGEALRKPGAATAALNYYRAGLLGRRLTGRIAAPTLVIWGERDPALGTETLAGLEEKVANLRIERLPEAGHFVQHDQPERVSALLVDFLRGA